MTPTPLKFLIDDPKFDVDYIIEEKNANSPQSLFIQGPFMMAEEKNKNGRIYPLNEMQVEVQRYIHEMVDTKRALGELNHPSCHLETASILTENGWKGIKDVTVGEKILTLNPNTNEIETQAVSRKIDEPYVGKMLRFHGRNIDLTVTPNHKMAVVDRNGKFELVEAQEIFNNRKQFNKHYIPKTALPYSGATKNVFTIPEVSVKNPKTYNNDVTVPLEIATEVFAGFMGFWLAEGWVSNEPHSYKISVSQNVGDELNQFVEKILNRFPSDITWKKTERDNKITYSTSDRRLYEYLKPLGKCYTKYIPVEIKKLDAPYLEELLYWFNIGDGRDQETWGGYRVKNNFSTSLQLVEDLCELQMKCGYSGNIQTIITEADYIFADRVIKAENKAPLYHLHASTTRGIYLDDRFLSIEEVEHDGRVYCVEVPNHTFYVMENGKSCWTGNSIDINPERSSHLITKLWQEGNLFYGKAKVLNTPVGNVVKSLLMDGVQLGVSSRALGKLTQTNEGNLVSNLHLIGVDVVHDPSASKALVDGILEAKSWIINPDGTITEALDALNRGVQTMPLKNKDEYIKNLIIGFLKDVKSR